jgi:hypothetical protein
MPLSAEDKAKAERLLLIASILTQGDLAAKLNANGPYLPNLATAITTATPTVRPLDFPSDYITTQGSDGRAAIATLRLVREQTFGVADALDDAYYSDPDSHRGFMNRLLAHIRS